MVEASVLQKVHAALAAKDATALAALTKNFPQSSREGLLALLQLYGDVAVLDEAEKALSHTPGAQHVLQHLKWFAAQSPDANVTFDLADLRGYSYYSGTRFALYAPGASDALVRGGRYDEVGAVFGRDGTTDIKQLVSVVPSRPLRAAIRAPWGNDAQLSLTIAQLRSQGETVVCVLPGHESEVDEFHCDRVLVQSAGQWVVQAI